MHLNWERLSMSAYFEALEAHNDMQSGEKKDPSMPDNADELRAILKANRNGG